MARVESSNSLESRSLRLRTRRIFRREIARDLGGGILLGCPFQLVIAFVAPGVTRLMILSRRKVATPWNTETRVDRTTEEAKWSKKSWLSSGVIRRRSDETPLHCKALIPPGLWGFDEPRVWLSH